MCVGCRCILHNYKDADFMTKVQNIFCIKVIRKRKSLIVQKTLEDGSSHFQGKKDIICIRSQSCPCLFHSHFHKNQSLFPNACLQTCWVYYTMSGWDIFQHYHVSTSPSLPLKCPGDTIEFYVPDSFYSDEKKTSFEHLWITMDLVCFT